jgi:hypothetical protein
MIAVRRSDASSRHDDASSALLSRIGTVVIPTSLFWPSRRRWFLAAARCDVTLGMTKKPGHDEPGGPDHRRIEITSCQ